MYGSGEEGQTVDAGDEPLAIRVTYGYSRDHRPDLKQWVMNLVCADSGGMPLLYAPGDGNQSDRAELVRLVRRYRESLNLGEVVVLDGASYSQENLWALEGFGWILRVPASLKEAQQLLQRDATAEAWLPLLPGYRGLEVEREYGGVRQRWLLVESEERARLAEEELNRRVARAEGEPPLAVGYRPLVRVELDQGKLERARQGLGRFLLATNVLDTLRLPAAEVLRRYKGQARTVERGFRFLKDPLFFASSTFLKRAERVMSLGMVMAVALLVYALGEWELRRKLLENQASLPDQKGRPTQRPTLRWVFQLFIWVRLVELEGRPLVLNLAPHHETAVRLLGAQRYYLLE